MLESLNDRASAFRSAEATFGSCGKAGRGHSKLAEKYSGSGNFAHKEVTEEELQVEKMLQKAADIPLHFSWGATLFHKDDLPMSVQEVPEIFTRFRQKAEKYTAVRECFSTPASIPVPSADNPGIIPSLSALGLEEDGIPANGSVLPFSGGEGAGLARLYDYFWEGDHLREYKETRNGLLGANYSSKFSAWLALGCLSPRKIYEEVQRYEDLREKNSSTYWMIFELIWRDYFRFICLKHGNKVFFKTGIKGHIDKPMRVDWKRFREWQEGRTRSDFVNANMIELKTTGFMSNRGRQNVASYLVNDLKLDWRMGAEWFESILVDYDVCSNWGNWNYVAGVGNDPREGRYFNVERQAERYDPEGAYVRRWSRPS
ncbi:MAG: DASH family cryptochrome [Bacteroidia bacterium]